MGLPSLTVISIPQCYFVYTQPWCLEGRSLVCRSCSRGAGREYRALGCKLGCRHHYTLMLEEHVEKWVHRRYGTNTQKAGGS